MASIPPPAAQLPVPELPELPEGVTPPAGRLPRWPWWVGPAALLGVLSVATTVVLFAVAVSGAKASDPPPAVSIGATFVQDLALVACAVLFAFVAGRPTIAQFGIRRTAFPSALGWLAVAWLGFFLFSAVYAAIARGFGVDLDDKLTSELGTDSSTAALVATGVLVCVVAPITEELFFRGFFFTALRSSMSLWPAALITGAVFGLIHFKLQFLLPLAVLGAALCLLYARTGSLIPCIALHSLNNSLAFGVTEHWTWEVPAVMAGSLAVVLAVVLPLAQRPAWPRDASVRVT
jgi:membrane protease YdiL (CAAX protease family)